MSNECETRKAYATDLSDEQWVLVEPMIPAAKNNAGGRPRKVCMREVVNTILYLDRTGCQWDMLPHDLLPKSTVYDYFAQWRDNGTLAAIVDALRTRLRLADGREATPSAACAARYQAAEPPVDREDSTVYYGLQMKGLAMTDKLFTIAEAAEHLHLSERSIRNKIHSGALDHGRVPVKENSEVLKIVIPLSSIEAYQARLLREAQT